eukprot:818380-Prorocentrum_lima.AAC.1
MPPPASASPVSMGVGIASGPAYAILIQMPACCCQEVVVVVIPFAPSLTDVHSTKAAKVCNT